MTYSDQERPRKDPSTFKNVPIFFSCSRKDADKLHETAEKLKISRSELIRRLIEDGLNKI